MNEWNIFLVLAELLGFFALIVPPLLKLNTNITLLTERISTLSTDMKSLTSDNSEAHKRIWEHSEKQDRQINDHENRIIILEEKESKR